MSSRLRILPDKPQPEAPASQMPGVVADQGFSGNVALVSLGCAKNTVDSEVMLGAFHEQGFRPVADPEHADIIVVNTCAFLKSAVEEGIDTILNLSEHKISGRCRRLIVAGCMVERYRNQLEESLPEVDRFLSTDELLDVAREVETDRAFLDAARRPYFLYDESMPRTVSTGGSSAYVKIAEGCDRPCAFCIIPKIRGAFRSRAPESILAEVRQLVEQGVREVNFIAQDLTAYGNDWSQDGRQSQLLRLIESVEGLGLPPFWLRLFYAYPIGVSQAFIEAVAQNSVVCNYLDMPLQHISHRVLKRMNRPLGGARTKELIENIRSWGPSLTLRTTMVVGFPGETEEDVRELEAFVSEGHFTHLGVFSYSNEPEAKAFTLDGQVAEEEKEERRARIMECQQKVVAAKLKQRVGETMPVLIEGPHAETALLTAARAEWQGPDVDGIVMINDFDDALLTDAGDVNTEAFYGKFGQVRITEVAGYDLLATLEKVT